MFGRLGRAAEEGDVVVWDGLRFNVLDVDGPRIEKLEIEFLGDGAGEETPAAAE